jgi:hypothetical protein
MDLLVFTSTTALMYISTHISHLHALLDRRAHDAISVTAELGFTRWVRRGAAAICIEVAEHAREAARRRCFRAAYAAQC